MLNAFSKLRRAKPARPKGFGSPPRAILTAVAIFLISQVAAVFLVELFYAAITPGRGGSSAFDHSAPYEFAYIILAEVLVFWLVWLALKRRGLKWPAIGFGIRPKMNDLQWSVIGFFMFFWLFVFVSGLLSALFPDINAGQEQDVGFKSASTFADYFMAFIALVFVAPVAEEVLVRGYLFSALRSKLRFLPTMIVTSLLFGAAHIQIGLAGNVVWLAAFTTFFLAVVLAYLRERTGMIYAGIAVHMGNNLFAYFAYFNS